jgi:quercetin dioxygenase-like cupin family protein
MPSPSSPAALLSMFVLGACTTVALQSTAATKPVPTDPQPTASTDLPTVIPLAEAPRAISPNGKGSIQHLARGHNAYVGRLRMDPGGAVPTHRDATEEFIHVLEGSGTMIIDGQSYAVTPGTTIYMPANAEVSYQNGDAEMVAIQVFAGPEPAKKYEAWTGVP